MEAASVNTHASIRRSVPRASASTSRQVEPRTFHHAGFARPMCPSSGIDVLPLPPLA
jgi:hypothetical protein